MVIDTSLFIEFLRSRKKEDTALYKLPGNVSYSLSSVTLFELYMGATTPEKENDIHLLTDDLNIISFDDEIALRAGTIYHELKKNNKMIDFRDIFIGATCLAHNLPLATLNEKHFNRIDGLILI